MTSVDFYVTEDDVMAWMRHATFQREQFRKQRRSLPWLVVALVTLLTFVVFWSWWAAVAGLALGVVLGLVLFPRLFDRSVEQQLRASVARSAGPSLGDQRMELRADGLYRSTHAGESTTRYTAISDVEVVGAHAFILLAPELAIVAPLSADGSMRAFVEELQRRL